MGVKEGDVVKIEYLIKDENGKLYDSSEVSYGGPIKIQVGFRQVFSGFEKNLIGMELGEVKEIILKPEEAFGDFNPLLVEKVPRSQFHEFKEIPIGKQIEYVGPNGMSSPAWIKLVEKDFVIIDMNPPLAGKIVKLTLKLLETDLEPDVFPNPFHIGISCEGDCNHNHEFEQ
ncbi:MAG: peptidylprolyl isomerase [Promethearchaeota archaeon]